MKKMIFGVMIGMLLCSGIVYASSYLAKDISYTNENWEVNNVSDAIDELYTSSKKSKKVLIKENYECNSKNAATSGYGKVMTHTIDVTDIEGYENLEADNFIIEVVGVSGSCNAKTSASKTTSKEYNPETGILTLSNYGHVWNQQTNNGYSQNYVTVDIWLIK